jgi:hypothetical protein
MLQSRTKRQQGERGSFGMFMSLFHPSQESIFDLIVAGRCQQKESLELKRNGYFL